MISLFQTELFGKTPSITFDSENCSCIESLHCNDGFERRVYYVSLEKNGLSCGYHFHVTLKEGSVQDCPVILNIDPFTRNPRYRASCSKFFPAAYIAQSGFIAVNVAVDELSADSGNRDEHDIMTVFPPRPGDGWCTIDAWAWCAYYTARKLPSMGFTSPDIIVSGFSRGARTALWCAALYPVFGGVYACQSGCCGAALFRGKSGERISDITRRYPWWSCDNFKKYADREDELPFDQDQMLGLIAPRFLYASSAREDNWSDAESEYRGVKAASVFFGAEKAFEGPFPSHGRTVGSHSLFYHVRNGVHDCTMEDWEHVISVLKNYLKRSDCAENK